MMIYLYKLVLSLQKKNQIYAGDPTCRNIAIRREERESIVPTYNISLSFFFPPRNLRLAKIANGGTDTPKGLGG